MSARITINLEDQWDFTYEDDSGGPWRSDLAIGNACTISVKHNGRMHSVAILAETHEPRLTCCLCGSTDDTRWCPACQHNFCHAHRWGWDVWRRGYAAVREWLTGNPPKHCAH